MKDECFLGGSRPAALLAWSRNVSNQLLCTVVSRTGGMQDVVDWRIGSGCMHGSGRLLSARQIAADDGDGDERQRAQQSHRQGAAAVQQVQLLHALWSYAAE